MNTKDRKENQFVLIEFSEEQQAFNFNLDGADKTAPSYMPIAWLPHLDAVRWTQEMKNLRADHRLTLEEVVERELQRCKTELNNLGNEKPSAAECMVENMKQLGKAISQMSVKASDLHGCTVQTPPKPIGYLEHEESMTRIPVFKRIDWFRRRMLRWCFGVKYIKED